MKKKKIFAKIASGQALFPPIIKAKNQHQNFEKHLKQKIWAIRCLNKSLEHLNVLLRIFFVSGVFQNFYVDFWALLKVEKVLALKQFWRKIFFSPKFYFLSSIWIYKLSASRITENSSHCYTLILTLLVYPRHLKEIGILSHKAIHAMQFWKNFLSEKAPTSKKFYYFCLLKLHTYDKVSYSKQPGYMSFAYI